MFAPLRRALTVFSAKAAVPATEVPRNVWQRIVERSPGDWQRRIRAERGDILAMPTAFSAQGLIAQDIAKARLRLVKWNEATGIFELASISWVDDLLTRPNSFQNRLQFIESWMHSKLSSGNAYVLKARGADARIRALYVLDPWPTRLRVSPAGSVFYEVQPDNLTGRAQAEIIPSTELIHDRFNTLYHPLVGVSPLHPASLAATLGIEILERNTRFWRNNAQPAGALIIPATVEEEEVVRLKEKWDQNYGAENYGRTAILAGGLDYKPFGQTARDSQLIDQMKLSREEIATAYRIPLYKLNAAPAPNYSNTGQLDQEYYSNCLQTHIENLEECLTLGLELPKGYRIQLEVKDLLRMDPLTKMQVLAEGVQRGVITINEARREDDRPPVEGGDTPMLQEQNWPLTALADRNRGLPKSAAAAASNEDEEPDEEADGDDLRAVAAFERQLENWGEARAL